MPDISCSLRPPYLIQQTNNYSPRLVLTAIPPLYSTPTTPHSNTRKATLNNGETMGREDCLGGVGWGVLLRGQGVSIPPLQYIHQQAGSTLPLMKKLKTEPALASPSATPPVHEQITALTLLRNHPAQLLPILQSLPHAYPLLTPAHKLRLAALVGFCHPVTNKQVQATLQQLIPSQGYWSTDMDRTLLLQTLNIICLIPGIDLRGLKLKEVAQFEAGSYEECLWVNCLSALSHGNFFQDRQALTSTVSTHHTLRLREFLNNMLILQRSVQQQIYVEQDYTEPTAHHYHALDIALADRGILTVDYYPEEYKGEYIEIWVDRTVELNSLLGNFVCKEKFGEFQYIRGPLMYAMQQGILLVLNNFTQISNELLVSLKSLCADFEITHNQKTIRAHAGFKIVGILSTQRNTKTKANIAKLVSHYSLPTKRIEDILPSIANEQNKQFLLGILKQNEKDLGYLGLTKLWKRIVRLRKSIFHLEDSTLPEEELNHQLWNGFFTQEFMDEIQLQINDLTNKTDPHRLVSFQEKYRQLTIGRTEISYTVQPLLKIVKTQYSLAVLEKLIVCFQLGEYPLLISETGCGKTTLVQYLAELSGHKLYVYNMSSGTDVTDLIGGFKPIDCRVLLKELFYGFLQKFRSQVPGAEKNESYLTNLTNYFLQGKTEILLKSLIQSIPRIIQQVDSRNLSQWKDLLKKFNNILFNLDKIDSNLVFSFIEGNLIKAIKNGDWILIDQINLATNDVLQKIVPLIEGKSLMLYEKGDLHYIERHPDFRIVACMNPANDSGKKALPPNLSEKFTTILMADPSRPDIEMMIKQICPQLAESDLSNIYFEIKKIKTVSLRNLTRALNYINRNKDTYGWNRSVYDGLMLGFGEKALLKKFHNETTPKIQPGCIELSGFLLQAGPHKETTNEIFHLTETFKQHLKDFLRAIAGTELPVLLEGPTSAGKTSMIRYVAETVGYKCIRINNHEHTEIEEYIGNYFPDKSGKLVFREGPLVQAVREGYWLILDELNLAKTEILECLNRLLDDNRQLFIPEQQKHLKPHPNFRIFATQNPSSYSGRKTLSRAFRNRFVSISFADITIEDTLAILQARSPLLKDSKQLSLFVKKTLESLSNYRQRQRVFEKDGLITIRNLLKWSERRFINKEKFSMQGYAILAQKLRNDEEKKFVQKVLLTNIKYNLSHIREEYLSVVEQQFSEEKIAQTNIYVQMNDSFKRMSALTIKAINNREPVLLVGQTGCGKTTLAELLAALTQRKFFSINCHKHMEASDLLGSLRPSTNPNSNSKFEFINGVVIDAMLEGGILLIDEINTAQDSVLERLNQVLECGLVGIERGEGWETVQAKQGFCIIATMNPSGDYGKKELSPALRNRFTEIWVEPITHPEYIVQAREDILKMINHKLNQPIETKAQLSVKIYEFLVEYNCVIAPRYNLTRKLLTMRDIGWICKFINECNFSSWQEKYFWSIIILAIEGIKYIMTDNIEGNKLEDMKDELLAYLARQIDVQPEWIRQTQPENIIALIKEMNFPLLIKTDIPIEVLGIRSTQQIFFSPQTDLSDLLGQYRPQGKDFIWHDEPLLKCVKEGGVVALVDLNMAQQQVIEGINSLFDHRGSLFVVELNHTFYKAATFKPIVVLRNETGHGRKGLPNSFLNRFVKLSITNVNIDIKLAYLCSKYPHIQSDEYLLSLVKRLLIQEKEISIEKIEFLVQFAKAGLLRESLDILHLHRYIENRQYNSTYSTYETQILELLPFKKSLNICNPELVKTAITLFLIYKFSTFNICLVGDNQTRNNLVKTLNYLLNTNLVKILISTMIDINDLLGTYEQISANQSIEEEKNLYQYILEEEGSSEYQSQETQFVFIESRVIKSLRAEHNLVYVEVPNDTIAERIEKGLKDVYHQRRQIVLGIDTLNANKTTISKFITVNLNELISQSIDTTKTYSLFPQNESNITHNDLTIRRQQTKNYIIDSINQQNDRKSITAWRRLLDRIYNKSNQQQEKNKVNIEEKIRRQTLQKYKVTYTTNQEREDQIGKILRNCWVSPHKDAFLSKLKLQCFFTSNEDELNKKLTYFNQEEEYLSKIIKKFQILYICNVNNFRNTSKAIMPILFNTNSNPQLVKRYFSEIDRLHEELFRFKVKEILIQFNEEEHKLIPILNNVESIRYLLSSDNLDVRRICDEGAHADHILSHVEAVVVGSVKLIEVDIQSISHWCRSLKIKHIGALQILEQNLSKKTELFKNLLNEPQIISFLKDLNLYDRLSGKSLSECGYELFQLFKPSKSMSLNVGYHLKNELNIKYYRELISDDEEYIKKYNQLIEIKYFKYHPQEYQTLEKTIGHYKAEITKIEKLLVYRGYNNIENLIEFYERLLHFTQQIEDSKFQPSTIRKIIIESYHTYYHIYNDILLPYYLSLLLIYIDSQTQKTEEMQIATIINTHRESVIELIEELIKKEEGEVDRSKDYLRFQKKFNKTVIVDQYTEEGVEKNKLMIEEDFAELFGKHSLHDKVKVQSPFEKIHMLVNKTKQNYYPYLSKTIFHNCSSYEHMIDGLQIMLKYEQKGINIYEEYNPSLIKFLVSPLPKILEEIHELINKYQIDNIKNLANLCSKIQQRSIYEQIYKVLIDCEFLIEKIFEVNAILPMSEHVNLTKLIENCLSVRKLQLKNWKEMMQLKIRRTEKSDMIEFIGLYKNIKEIQNDKELFALCERFLRESKLSCLNNRIRLLLYLEKNQIIPRTAAYQNALHRVIGFYEYLMPDIMRHKATTTKQKELQMKEYEKLAGWNSNEYLIFKATCQKFQRKIHHILKRYDEELSMDVGTYHQQILAKQIFQSMKEFKNGLSALVQNKFIEQEEPEEEEDSNGDPIVREEKIEPEGEIQEEEEKLIFNEDGSELDDYQLIIRKIFFSLSQLQAEHHSTQSKLLIIRNYLAELEDVFTDFTLSSKVEYRFLTREMFSDEESYSRGIKYYYGLWDKLCQRAESKWNREVIDRLWHITEKIWVHLNLCLKFSTVTYSDELAQDLRVVFGQFFKKTEKYHPLFERELTKVKEYLSLIDQKEKAITNTELLIPTNLINMMKLGYILANITVNLQKNGLCAKEETEENNESGEEEIGDGMGIGEGEAHEAAQNVGDEIEFEQQVMGHKDEEKNENNNAGNKQENDIEMEADFQGDMFSKEEEQEGKSNEEGEQKEADQKMGDVDNNEREQDMKNEAGEAEGEEEADVDIQNQKEGDQQLVDNEREDKEQRKGEEKRDIDEQEGEEEKSDWDENNQEGDKINKQKEDVQALEESPSYDLDQEKQAEQVDDKDKDKEDEQNESGQEQENENKQQENSQIDEQQLDQEGNKDVGEQIDEEPQQPEQQKDEDDKKKERRSRNNKKYDAAYGRRDMNTNNQVLNDQQQPMNEANNDGNEQQGQGEGEQGSGNPIHNLSADFLEQILRQQKSEGTEQFVKDLNVIVHDQNEPQANKEEENAEQYELTEQKDKFATNLPLMDDQKMVDEKQEQEKKEEKKGEDRNEDQKEKKDKKAAEEKDDKTKKEVKKDKNSSKPDNNSNENKNKNVAADEKNEKMHDEKNIKTEDSKNREKQQTDEQKSQLIKNAIQALKIENKEVQKMQIENDKNILSESYQVSKILQEQLKSVLQPMDNAEYRGDFKTGKKLNLKKIIPFIASNFRKDRIWLRRTEPCERNYYVMIALDDTKSMHYGNVGGQALKGLLAISMALEHLSIKTSICSIRDEMVMLKRFGDLLNSPNILNSFQFGYESSNSHDLSMASFMNSSLQTFKKVEEQDANVQVRKLCFIISDGKMNKKLVQPFMKDIKKEDITYVFIIVDSQQSSILNIKTVDYVDGKMKIKNYMSDFPFEYFLIINDVKELGEILALTLMQFIQEK